MALVQPSLNYEIDINNAEKVKGISTCAYLPVTDPTGIGTFGAAVQPITY